MAESAPIRPQRIIRANRETTGGLLMSVIRSLTASRDSTDRDRERLELEKGFQQCDSKLNELISQHGNDLYQVMAIFSKILTNLSKAKERLIDTRDKLLNCQKLLHCKRDELKKLWLEIVENRAVYDLLERVEQVASLPSQVEAYAEKKHYLHAGQCCIDGLRQLGATGANAITGTQSNNNQKSTILDQFETYSNQQTSSSLDSIGNLSKIDALAEVRMELLQKKEMLFEKCLDELHRHLYIVSTESIRKRYHQIQQQQQQQKSKFTSLDYDWNRKIPMMITTGIEMININNNNNQIISHGQNQSENNQAEFDAYPEEDSGQFISMLTKCIGLLNKIPDAVKIIKERFDEEFVQIVIRTAHDVINFNNNDYNDPNHHHHQQQDQLQQQQQQQISLHAISFFDPLIDGQNDFSTSSSSTTTANNNPDLIVLTCTRLLGHHYNGFSHLYDIDNELTLQLPRQSLQLQQLFDMLLEQFYQILQLHNNVVLRNFKRIESSLNVFQQQNEEFNNNRNNHGFGNGSELSNDYDSLSTTTTTTAATGTGTQTPFYSSIDIWFKIQLLIQQLLDYYLDVGQLSGQPTSTTAAAAATLIGSSIVATGAGGGGGGAGTNSSINYNLVSALFPTSAVNKLFGTGHSSAANHHHHQTATATDSNVENYSSFFIKKRPMMVAGAMNAMNVMMMNASSSSSALSSSSINKNLSSSGGGNIGTGTGTSNINTTTSSGQSSMNLIGGDSSVTSSSTTTGTGTTTMLNDGSNISGTGGNIPSHYNHHHHPTTSHNLLQSFSPNWRTHQTNLFKFDHSTQAISWNSFLQQQQLQMQQQQQQQQIESSTSDGLDNNENNDNNTGGGGGDTSEDSNQFQNSANKSSANNATSGAGPTATHSNINNRLFNSLQSIIMQSPDNLVLLYDNLLKNLQKCPINDLIKNEQQQQQQQQISSTLQSYLIANSEKFTQHISSQLDAMLEQAQKSLESGITIVLIDKTSSLLLAKSQNDFHQQQKLSRNQIDGGQFEQISRDPSSSTKILGTNNISSSSNNSNSNTNKIGSTSSTSASSSSSSSSSSLQLVLLESTVLVDVAVRDLSSLMMVMNDYRQHYLSYICNVLTAYKDSCKRMYDNVSCPLDAPQQPLQPTGGTMTSTIATSNLSSSLSHIDNIGQLSSSTTGQQNFESNRRTILSSYWARNEDINRLLKSQPNWIQLKMEINRQQQQQNYTKGFNNKSIGLQQQQQQKSNHATNPISKLILNRQILSTSSSFDESPEDISKRNANEIDILMNLLSKHDITRNELIYYNNYPNNPNQQQQQQGKGQFTLLANMQQSFEWLSKRSDNLVELIQKRQQQQSTGNQSTNQNNPSNNPNNPNNNNPFEVYIATLNQISNEFEQLSELCLLVLHLEIRIHCFYHLQLLDAQFFTTSAPLMSNTNAGNTNQSSSSNNSSTTNTTTLNSSSFMFELQSDDQRIMPLLDDLQSIYNEISLAKFSTKKMSYLFEGLGDLISKIFFNSIQKIKRIKINGIKRTCRALYDIQRRLTLITKSRELSLDYCRQYFELFLMQPEEIFSLIIERGKQFKPKEYQIAITLIHQSMIYNNNNNNNANANIINANSNSILSQFNHHQHSYHHHHSSNNNAIDQHQSQQQLQRLLKRLDDILAEVSN